jgi:hypothetical protein
MWDSLFCSQILLALVAVSTAETPRPTTPTPSLPASATQETASIYEKGKRTTSAETSPQNVQYGFSEEAQPTRYITQPYVKAPPAKPQGSFQVPQKVAAETKTRESPETTYSLQYVPSQLISHVLDTVPPLQTANYNQILQKAQQTFRVSVPAQNSIIPQQQYILHAPLHDFAAPSPIPASFYNTPPTAHHPSVAAFTPGHHIFNPVTTFIVPHHGVPAAYGLQPVVMIAVPGGYHLNAGAGHSALLSLLGTAGSGGRTAPAATHSIPRQQLTYLTPPEASPTVRQVRGDTYSTDRRTMPSSGM